MMTFLKRLKPYLQLNTPWKQKAWDALEKKGLPTKKWDAFKYVSLKDLWQTSFIPQIRTFPNVEGAVSLPLEEGRRVYAPFFQKNLAKTLELEASPFALLNEALSQEGQFIYLPPGKEVHWTWKSSLTEGLRLPRVELFIGKGAHFSLDLQCQGDGLYFYNPYLQITLEEGASATFNMEYEHSIEAFGMHTIRARLKKNAAFKYFVFSKGARSERHDLDVSLNGEKSQAELKGLSLATGKNAIHHFVTVRHRDLQTFSSQEFKAALSGKALSSFQGNILVEKKAQKTQAYQLSRHLFLSDWAKGMSQPNLEIFADDVKASHGATLSQLKQEELLYLQMRGLTLREAKKVLVQGFCERWVDRERIHRFLDVREEDAPI